MIYGKLPVFLGQFEISLPEVMYYLYLPVWMGHLSIAPMRVPENVRACVPLIIRAMDFATSYGKGYDYVYLSARKGWATPDNPLNRPGWHCDGFGTDDLNFVWWDGPGTRFAVQPFEGIVSDHNRSLAQFNEQVDDRYVCSFPQHGLYALDQTVVHATPIVDPPGRMRQYIKVSVSNARYNLENNSHNYMFDYDWPLHSREALRNDPHKAQNDFVEDGV